MYELVQLTERTHYIQSPAKIGLVELGDDEVCLIDSGNDRDAGRRVRRILDERGWHLRAIYNTHSNADHIGGNRYLQAQTGCRVYAPGIECDLTNHPILEPALLYGGHPFAELRHKFLLAKPSVAEPLTPEVLPEGFEMIALPGHFLDMVGFRTPDDVVFLADCLSSRATLDKYRITFIWDVAAYLETLGMVSGLKARAFVPAHADATDDVGELAAYNAQVVDEIAHRVLALCARGASFEEVLKGLFDGYGLSMDFQQYALVGSTVRSYLAWLKDAGRLDAYFEGNRLLWMRV